MKLVTFISAGVFLIVSSFEVKNKNTAEQTLFDTKWSLKKIHHPDSTEEVFTKAFIKFNREKKSAGGNGSCNTFGSSVSLQGNKISFSNIFSTKMYCEGVQQTEDSFFSLLQKVNRFEVKDKSLLLLNGKDVLLKFESE